MSYAFAPAPEALIPVDGAEGLYFPVRRVYGVARNYAEPGREAPVPFVFMKPADCVAPVAPGTVLEVPMPPQTQDLRHEIELVACLGKGGRNLSVEEAKEAVWGWCAGIDFTLGDQKLASGANDVTRAKSFERSAPVSYVRPVETMPVVLPAALKLSVNGEERQNGTTEYLVKGPFEVIAELSKFWELRPGDIVFTGTPGGAARVVEGDLLEGEVEGTGAIAVRIGKRSE